MTDDDLIAIPTGTFTMGAPDGPHPEDGEGPERPVTLSAYRIGRTTVTAEAFARFVADTGFITTAERAGGSLVFAGELVDPDRFVVAAAVTPWWRWVPGACWQAPQGRGPGDPALPVVHVCHQDAFAYAVWSGCRLPTEAEWECAAQTPGGPPHIWQGRFPNAPSTPPGPMPAASGRANAQGLLHATGNVWEWVADRFTRLHGPGALTDPKGPLNGDLRVVKGGSFLCCPSYCARFRPSSRRGEPPQATASNLGFRVAR